MSIADFTADDMRRIARNMANDPDAGFTADDVAEAMEKPWKWPEYLDGSPAPVRILRSVE